MNRAWPTSSGVPGVPHSVGMVSQCQPVLCQPVQPWPKKEVAQSYNLLDMNEVTRAVESLYQDELKPYGRILRKRLAERAERMGIMNPDVDIKRLKGVCDNCPWIYVQAEEGGDWSALLCSRSMTSFVDVYSPHDFYPPKMWQAAASYFESLDDAHMVLPGGRYSCAQALVTRGLDFLSNRSLGQVCHIVQLAISQKKLLGYLNGAVVPYRRSQSMIKERCAERQRPCTNATRSSGSELADWEKVKYGLKEILFSLAPGTNTIPLSNVKRLFRSRYHTELSETALGHSKLSELLQDPRLKDICHVRLQGHGYVVGPAMNMGGGTAHIKPPNSQPYAPYAPAPPHPSLVQVVAPGRQPPHVPGPVSHPSQGLSVAAAGAAAASAALAAAGRGKGYDRPSLRDRARFVQPLSMEDVEERAWSPRELPGAVVESTPLMPATPDTPGFPKWGTSNQMEAPHVQNTFLHYHIPPTPTPQQCRSQSLPRNHRTDPEPGLDWKSDALNQHPANRLMTAAAAAAELPKRGLGSRAICLADLL